MTRVIGMGLVCAMFFALMAFSFSPKVSAVVKSGTHVTFLPSRDTTNAQGVVRGFCVFTNDGGGISAVFSSQASCPEER